MNGLVVDFTTGLPRQKDSVWHQFSGSIDALSTHNLDEIPLSELRTLTYELSFYGPLDTDVKSLSMKVQRVGADAVNQVFSRIGEMNILVNTVVVGSDLVLQAVNQENFEIEYCLTVLTM